MNKNEFLNRLDKELSVLDKEERKELLDFYEERFYTGNLYENKTEQDIIAELESPSVIARNILTEYGVSPKYVKTKEERYQNLNTTQVVLILLFDVFVAAWAIPSLFSITFSLFGSLLTYFTTLPIIFGNPTSQDVLFFILLNAVYFLLLMISIFFFDLTLLVTKKIVIWHLNVFKLKNRDKWIKKLNKTSIDNFMKRRKKLNFLKTVLTIVAIGTIVVTGTQLLFNESNYIDSVLNRPLTTDYYNEDVTADISNLEEWTINTNFENMEVEVKTTNGTEILVSHRYKEFEDFTIDLDTDTNTLTLKNEGDNLNFITSFEDFLLLFGPRNRVVIEIPENLVLSSVDVETFNGYIKVHDVMVKEVTANTLNGDVKVYDLDLVEDLDISTSNGKILVENVDAPNETLKATTLNGDVEVKSSNFKNYNLSTGNGMIELTRLNIVSKDGISIDAITGNGDIRLEDVYVSTISLETGNGDIYYNNDLDKTWEPNSYSKETGNGSLYGNMN